MRYVNGVNTMVSNTKTKNQGDRIRTCGLVDPNHTLYQAELHPDNVLFYFCRLRVKFPVDNGFLESKLAINLINLLECIYVAAS